MCGFAAVAFASLGAAIGAGLDAPVPGRRSWPIASQAPRARIRAPGPTRA